MADAATKLMSVEEFLVWDDGTDTRYELVDGRPIAMSPGAVRHGVIAGRLAASVTVALRGRPGCNVVPEAGIRSAMEPRTFFIADFAVSCADVPSGANELKYPILVVEVLSPSTERTDRRRKLHDYRQAQSVQEIVLIDATEMFCEVHRRIGEIWRTDLLRGADAVLRLDSVGLEIGLGELYAGIELDEARQDG